MGLVSLCQIWDFYGYSLNTLKYAKMGIRYFFLFRVQQEYNKLLVNALNRIFKRNLSLNTFKWLLTKVELLCVRIIYPVLENASEMDTPF